ncbi:GNAT family acetyltransferase [Phellopilus nigrolimitatus]|nr:GNAT family acetyltransferase [Phellopilus nigrolimitatus]
MSYAGAEVADSAPQDLVNFAFPVRDLESTRVKLTPFIAALHAKAFFEGSKAHPELYTYFPPGPFASIDEFIGDFSENRVLKEPSNVLFAILDKTGPEPRVAGIIGLLNTDKANLSTEIGFVLILPAFQRTHVTSNAVGLLLHYCLELPFASFADSGGYGPGLGLRRVQWQTHAENARSVRTAERLGFQREGIIRWQRVLREGKAGFEVPPERRALDARPGRHSWMLSLCWDDWELEGAREAVRSQMNR